MATILKQRRDTAANWSSANPVIPAGQLCFDITNNTFRIGDGTTNYSSLMVQSGVPGDMSGANNLSELTNTTTARSNLGVVIGTNVQAFDATIMVDADIGTTVQAFDATIVVDGDIGVNVQAFDADTSKVDVAETRTANIDLLTYSETKIAMSANSVNLSLGNVFTKTISEKQGHLV